MNHLVSPSLLAADFGNIERDIRLVNKSEADWLHLDIMDGVFVPNISFGFPVLDAVKKITEKPMDVHLMIKNPFKYTDAFVDAGADMITVHIETVTKAQIEAAAKSLKKRGIKFGISLNPATPLAKIKPVLKSVDFVLVMSVNPGFGGQSFIPAALPKIKELRKIFKKDISVDGGINDRTAALVIAAGANILAAGSYIFGAKNVKTAIERIRHAS